MESLLFSRKKTVRSTLRVPLPYRNRTNIKKTKIKLVRHGCVLYAYRTSTSTREVPGTGTFCKLEYPCFRGV